MMYENVERLHGGIITLSYPEEWECIDVLRVRTHVNREIRHNELYSMQIFFQ